MRRRRIRKHHGYGQLPSPAGSIAADSSSFFGPEEQQNEKDNNRQELKGSSLGEIPQFAFFDEKEKEEEEKEEEKEGSHTREATFFMEKHKEDALLHQKLQESSHGHQSSSSTVQNSISKVAFRGLDAQDLAAYKWAKLKASEIARRDEEAFSSVPAPPPPRSRRSQSFDSADILSSDDARRSQSRSLNPPPQGQQRTRESSDKSRSAIRYLPPSAASSSSSFQRKYRSESPHDRKSSSSSSRNRRRSWNRLTAANTTNGPKHHRSLTQREKELLRYHAEKKFDFQSPLMLFHQRTLDVRTRIGFEKKSIHSVIEELMKVAKDMANRDGYSSKMAIAHKLRKLYYLPWNICSYLNEWKVEGILDKFVGVRR
jgi:hypothetical protein